MRVLAILPAMVLAACASAGSGESVANLYFAPEEGVPNPIPNGVTFATPLETAQSWPSFDSEGEGSPTFDLRIRRSDQPGVFDVLITSEGYADDSVAGEQKRMLITQENGRWRIVSSWSRYKCYRGANPGQWQKGRCV